jgi:hypothetical protein
MMQAYDLVWQALAEAAGLPASAVLDLRGNHDVFDTLRNTRQDLFCFHSATAAAHGSKSAASTRVRPTLLPAQVLLNPISHSRSRPDHQPQSSRGRRPLQHPHGGSSNSDSSSNSSSSSSSTATNSYVAAAVEQQHFIGHLNGKPPAALRSQFEVLGKQQRQQRRKSQPALLGTQKADQATPSPDSSNGSGVIISNAKSHTHSEHRVAAAQAQQAADSDVKPPPAVAAAAARAAAATAARSLQAAGAAAAAAVGASCPAAVLLGLDLSPNVGLLGTANFFGVASSSMLEDIEQQLQALYTSSSSSSSSSREDQTATVPPACMSHTAIISYSHYPFSTVAGSYRQHAGQRLVAEGGRALRDLLMRYDVSAHLSGHLHDLLGPHMQAMHLKGSGVHGQTYLADLEVSQTELS